jgi:hypothetical protein
MILIIGCILSLVLTILHLIETYQYDDQPLWGKIIFYPTGTLVFCGLSWLGVIIILLNIKYDTEYRLQNRHTCIL